MLFSFFLTLAFPKKKSERTKFTQLILKHHKNQIVRNLRLLVDYLAATRNEIAVDRMLLGLAHVEPAQVGYLPRVPHWIRRAIQAPALTRTVWRLAWIFWLAGGAVIYFALELLKFNRLQARNRNALTKTVPLTEGAVLGLSTRVCDVLDYKKFPWLPAVWLTCPWARQHSLPAAAVELPLMSLLTREDLREAFAWAVRATYALARDPDQSRWALQSYTALRWFMVRLAVDKISGTLVTTEHFDRWAVLADRSIRATREKVGSRRRLVVVQHGALGGLGGDGQGENALAPLPTRLSCVDELHAYDADEEAAFRRVVLIGGAGRPPLRVHYFSPTITLTGARTSGRHRLLFVGHPLCENFQTRVYLALRDAMDIEAFYKPHPKAPMSASMTKVGWTIIENSKTFPRVELLVSYPSTLVIEYKGAGIPACVHPLDIGADALPEYLEQVMQKIGASSAANVLKINEPLSH